MLNIQGVLINMSLYESLTGQAEGKQFGLSTSEEMVISRFMFVKVKVSVKTWNCEVLLSLWNCIRASLVSF